jgi:viologen exporter family transport system permease protein
MNPSATISSRFSPNRFSVMPYLSVFRMRFLLMLQYRTAAIAGFATQCWWGLIKVMVFAAFYRSTIAHQPINFAQAVTYTWLGQAFLVLLPWFADPEVASMVRTGDVSYDRLRPLDTYFYWYVRAMGWSLARLVPRAALMFAMAGLILPLVGLSDWRLRSPSSLEAGLLFAPAMLSVLLLSSAMVMLINIAAVASMNERGANALMVPLVNILSGSIVPLPFFPDWMQWVLFIQPFAGLVDIPYRIYFGNLTGVGALAGIIQQLIWTAILLLIGKRLMARVTSRMQIQGG